MQHSEISFELVGEILGEDIFSDQGILLLKKGTVLKETHILLLQNFRFGENILVEISPEKASVQKKSPSQKPYQSSFSIVKDAFNKIVHKEAFDMNQFLEKYRDLLEITFSDISIFRIIQNETKKEDYLYQHSINTGIIASIIGKRLGFSKRQCLLLGYMGLFHDIGMLLVDPYVVAKEGILTEREYDEVKRHTFLGYHLLRNFKQLDPLVAEAALSHHERIDGCGYPKKVKEKNIPYFIQIVSVADCFNAMNMKNYGDKKTQFELVYELIDEAHNNKLNPAIVIPFAQYIMRQNLHEMATLTDGNDAEIVFIHEHEPHQPLIRIGEEYIDLRKASDLRLVALAKRK